MEDMLHLKSTDRMWTQKQGQAGVHQVASQLLLRGLNVCFPSVDEGYDLLVDGGLRVQVKSARLSARGTYKGGAYWFKLQRVRSIKRRLVASARTFSDECDVVVLWGIDLNRFWIVPANLLDGCQSMVVGQMRQLPRKNLTREQIDALLSQGMSARQIADQFDVSYETIRRKKNGENLTASRISAVAEYEGRWDIVRSHVALLKQEKDELETEEVAI